MGGEKGVVAREGPKTGGASPLVQITMDIRFGAGMIRNSAAPDTFPRFA